jgi:26S proteasome regulatory subunit N5
MNSSLQTHVEPLLKMPTSTKSSSLKDCFKTLNLCNSLPTVYMLFHRLTCPTPYIYFVWHTSLKLGSHEAPPKDPISTMSSTEEIGKKADLGPEYQRVLPQAQATAASGDVERACEMLLTLEKQARLANDVATLKEVVAALLTLCAQHKRWELLKDHVALLSKRRAQKSGAVTVVVQRAMEFLAETPSDAVKMELINALRAVAEGKIFLEKERATLTQMLSRMKEARGEIDEAATILQEVHVETYGAMTKLEKTEYILEQVRLTLAKKDYVRANILAKKILRRTLEEKDFQDCKLKFYHLMIEYDTHENNTLELCRHWMAILNTDTVKEKEDMWKKALEHATVFVVLSAYSNLQNDLLHKLASEKLAEKVPDFAAVLKKFTTKEIIAFPMEQDAVLKKHPVFNHAERGAEWWKLLHTRVVEHNIRVVAEHYDRIHLPHLAKMIGLAEDVREPCLLLESLELTVLSVWMAVDGEQHLHARERRLHLRQDRPPCQARVVPPTALAGGAALQLVGYVPQSRSLFLYLPVACMILTCSCAFVGRSGYFAAASPGGDDVPLSEQREHDPQDLRALAAAARKCALVWQLTDEYFAQHLKHETQTAAANPRRLLCGSYPCVLAPARVFVIAPKPASEKESYHITTRDGPATAGCPRPRHQTALPR